MTHQAEESAQGSPARSAGLPAGLSFWPGHLDRTAQEALLRDLRHVAAAAPFRRQRTPGGRPMSVRTTACGAVGWISGPRGYGYASRQPSGAPWPPIPGALREMWQALLPGAPAPDSALLNLYRGAARMGLHQDRDEADLTQPVLSISLGDDALFRVGGLTRDAATRSFWLRSGDVIALSGPARMVFHGIDRLRPGTSRLLEGGGRLNVTLRVALSALRPS